MPLIVNVGRSVKASRNYNSRGTSINLTAELDSSLLQQPEQLKEAIATLYAQADAALDEACRGDPAAARPELVPLRLHPSEAALLTIPQRRTIEGLAERLKIRADDEARQVFEREVADLTVKEASRLIDHLRRLEARPTGS